jgi:phospholipid/cholesterol/gamma-HCH transport system permease protein
MIKKDGTLDQLYGAATLEELRKEYPSDEESYADELRHRLEQTVEKHYREVKGPDAAGETPAKTGSFFKALYDLYNSAWEWLKLVFRAVFGARPNWNYIREVGKRFVELATSSVPLIMVAGFVVGLVSTWQSGLAMQMWGYNLLPRIMGVAICHHIGALFTGLFLAGRVSAMLASQFSVRRLTRQYDAVRTFGLDPVVEWLSPVMLVSLIAFALMAFIFQVFAYLGGLVVFTWVFHQKTFLYSATFLEDVALDAWIVGMIKTIVFGGAVAVISYVVGTKPKKSSDDVGNHTTRAVVYSLMAVIALDFVISVFVNLVKELLR